MKLIKYGIVLFLIAVLFCSCGYQEGRTSLPEQTSFESSSGEVLIEENTHYILTKNGVLFYYYILDDGQVVQKEGPFNRQPRITMADETTVKVTTQAGTGIGTQSGYYYDIVHNVFSPVYRSIYDESNGKVAYVEQEKVIIREIFEEEGYYIEISSFERPLSEMVDPFTQIQFANNATTIIISYHSGEDYEEVSEEFVLE